MFAGAGGAGDRAGGDIGAGRGKGAVAAEARQASAGFRPGHRLGMDAVTAIVGIILCSSLQNSEQRVDIGGEYRKQASCGRAGVQHVELVMPWWRSAALGGALGRRPGRRRRAWFPPRSRRCGRCRTAARPMHQDLGRCVCGTMLNPASSACASISNPDLESASRASRSDANNGGSCGNPGLAGREAGRRAKLAGSRRGAR